jgi:DNA-binding IclR family transcriptional regulator
MIAMLLGSPRPLGISELARELDLSKSTVHGILHTLNHLGLLEKDETKRKFQPASEIVSLWREALLKGPLKRAGHAWLEAFSRQQGLTTLTGVFLGGKVLIVDAVVAPAFSIAAYSGQIIPIWAGALGKAYLATLSRGKAKALTDELAQHSPLSRADYLAHVEQARQTGVAIDRDEYLEGVCALAAIIREGKGIDPTSAVWCVGLTPAISAERLGALVPRVRELAGRVRNELESWGAGVEPFRVSV